MCAAVCCSVRVAACCSVLQCVAVCCVAACCSALQRGAVRKMSENSKAEVDSCERSRKVKKE